MRNSVEKGKAKGAAAPAKAGARGAHAAAASQLAQMRQLKVSLMLRAILLWAVFSVLFWGAAWAINKYLVPDLAERVAEESAPWNTYYFDDMSFEDALSDLEYKLEGFNVGPEALSSSAASSESIAERNLGKDDVVFDAREYGGDNWWIGWVPIDDASNITLFLNGNGCALSLDPEKGVPIDYAEKYLKTSPDTFLAYVKTPSNDFEWISVDDLKSRAIQSKWDFSGLQNVRDIQVVASDDSVSWRNLSAYNMVKSLKVPIAVVLYLIGIAIIAYMVFRKSLGYFGDLSDAVTDLIGDRETPIELPPELSATENELNAIRLASLSDERAAVAAERRKDELVAYLAHDIKTPLTSVIGYLMLLDESPDLPDEARMRYIHIASDKSQRLESMVDEFFEITRYNLQSIPLERSQIDLRLFLEQVAEEFAPSASSACLNVRVDSESALVFVDGDKLARAVGNVLRNAIAYANAGTDVTVTGTKGEEAVTICVEDIGREISEAHLVSIFDNFYREDSARSSNSGHAGLGLAIAKEIVVAHGGDISAKSHEGVTSFAITIPL